MTQEIHFTTSPNNAHVRRTRGLPVHDGEVPRNTLRNDPPVVAIDGEAVNFTDETVPGRLHNALQETHTLKWRTGIVDAIVFTAIMQGARYPLSDLENILNIDKEDYMVKGDDAINAAHEDPIVLASGYHDNVVIKRHIVTPSHFKDEPKYLHKLGDKGPVCISTLEEAMGIFGCNLAFPVRTK